MGQAIKQQAEELEKKAKEVAHRVDNELQIQAKKIDSKLDPKQSKPDVDVLDLSPSSNVDQKDGLVLNTATATASTSLANRDLDSVSKEELLEILSKMNKKVKTLAQLRAALTDRVKAAESDKARLMDIMKKEVLNEMDLEEAAQKAATSTGGKEQGEAVDEITLIQLAWRAADERNQYALQHLQNEYKIIAMQSQAEMEKVKKAGNKTDGGSADDTQSSVIDQRLEESEARHKNELMVMQAEHKAAIETLQADADERVHEATKVASNSGLSNDDILALREQFEGKIAEMKSQHEEKMRELKGELSSLQEEQLEKAKQEIVNLSRQIDESASQHIEQVKAILAQQDETIQKLKKEAAEDKTASMNKLKEMVKEKITQMKSAFETKLSATEEDNKTKMQTALDELRVAHEKEMEVLKAHSLSQPDVESSTDISSASNLIREEMQKSHALELQELRSNFEQEKEALIRDITAKHTEEIEKSTENQEASLNQMKESMRQKMDEMQASFDEKLKVSSKASSDNVAVVEQLKSDHAKQLSQLRDEHALEIEKLLSRNADALESHRIELSSLREELDKSYEEKLKEMREMLSVEHENALKVVQDTSSAEILEMKIQTEKRIEDAIQKGMEMASGSESERLSALQKEYELKIKELEASHSLTLENVKDLSEKYQSQLDELRVHNENTLSELQTQMTSEKSEALTSLRAQLESEFKEKSDALNEQISTLKGILDNNKDNAEVDKDALKREIVESYEKKISDLISSQEERLEQASSDFTEKMQLEQERHNATLVDFENKIMELSSAVEDKDKHVSSLERELDNERAQSRQLQSKLDEFIAAAEEESCKRKQQDEETSEQAANLEVQLHSYCDQINQLKQQIDAVNALVDEKSRSLQEVTDALHEKTQMIETLESERDAHQEALDTSLTLVAEESLDKIRVFEDQMSQMKDEHFKELGKLTSDYEALVQEREVLRSDLMSARQAIEKMEMEAETLRTEGDKETASLKREIAKYSEQNAVLANEVKSQEDDISRLRDSLVSYESNENDVFVELEKAREELSVLNAAQQDLQNNLDQSHTLIDSLRKDVDIKDKLLKSSEDAYSEEVSNSNKKLKELTEELDKLREQQKSIEISNNELDNAISNKVSIIESLTQMNEQLTSQIEIISSEKEEIIKELDELRNSIQKSDESMISFDEKVSMQESTIQNLIKEIDALKSRNQSLIDEKSVLEEASIVKNNEICELKKSLQDNTDQTSTMEYEMNSLREKLAASEAKVLEITGSLASKELSITNLVEEVKVIESLRSENVSLSEEISSLKAELDSVRNSAKEVTTEIQAAEISNQNAIRKYEEQITTLEDKIKVLIDTTATEKSAIQEGHHSELENLRVSYENQLLTLQNKINDIESQANSERDEFLEKISILEESTKKMSSEIDSDKESATNSIKEEYEQKLIELKEAHENQKKEILEKLKVKFNEKLKSAIAEQNATKSALQEKMTEHTDKLKAFFEGKVNKLKEELDAAHTKFEAEKKELQGNLSKVEMVLVSLKDENNSLQDKLKSQITREADLSKQLEQAQIELSNASSNSKAAMSSLLAEQESISKSHNELKVETAQLRETLATKTNIIEEMTGRINALQENLNTLISENESARTKLDSANKQVAKLDAAETELGSAREEINRLKLELSQNNSLLERMKAEQDSFEKKHGQRTAVVGMLEQQLQELNDVNAETKAKLEAAAYDLTQKDDDLRAMKEELDQTQKALEESRKDLDATRKKIGAGDSQGSASKELLQKAKLAESLQREVQSLHQQMAKKSSAAQKLLQQRESDCQELKTRIKALQHELDKGSFSDRRIFELAAQQSNRESIASSEIEVRNQLVERLTHTLEVNDDNLALAELNAKLQAGQVEELCRIHRREDVNLDYLKATIVQYLSKPPGSSERAALLPVIATLLQFDDDDYKTIEAGKNKVTWFGSVMPTFINAPVSEEIKPKTPAKNNGDATPLLSNSSAEVKISRPPEDTTGASGRRKGTSLQF